MVSLVAADRRHIWVCVGGGWIQAALELPLWGVLSAMGLNPQALKVA